MFNDDARSFSGGKVRNSNYALYDRFNISLFDPKLPYRSCLPFLLPPPPTPSPPFPRPKKCVTRLFLYCVRRTMCVHHWSVGRGGSSTSQSVCACARAHKRVRTTSTYTRRVVTDFLFKSRPSSQIIPIVRSY